MKLKSKNSFLKRISCIALSLMLCLTSFTLAGFVPTLEAEAAELPEAVSRFETDMAQMANGTEMYQSVKPAYEAYVNFFNTLKSLCEGKSADSADLDTAANNLKTAVDTMESNRFSAPTGTFTNYLGTTKVFIDAENSSNADYKKIYKNVLYSETGLTNKDNSCGASKLVGFASGESDYKTDDKVFIPESTLLYNGGETPQVAAMYALWGNDKPWNYNWKTLRVFCCYVSNTTDIGFAGNWKGYDGRLNQTYVWFNRNELSISGTGDTTKTYYNQGTSDECFYTNVLQVKKSFSESDPLINTYTPTFNVRVGHDKKNALGTIPGSKVIRVVNYKNVIGRIKNAEKKYYANVSNYRQGGLRDYIRVIDEIKAKNPNDYFSTTSNDYNGLATYYDTTFTDLSWFNAKADSDVNHADSSYDWTVTKEATCTETGSKNGVCRYCGATTTATIDALGHDYGPATPNSSEDKDKHTIQVHQKTCSRCNDVLTELHNLVYDSDKKYAQCKDCVYHTEVDNYTFNGFRITKGNLFDFDKYASKTASTKVVDNKGTSYVDTENDTITVAGSGYDVYTNHQGNADCYTIPVIGGNTYTFSYVPSKSDNQVYVFFYNDGNQTATLGESYNYKVISEGKEPDKTGKNTDYFVNNYSAKENSESKIIFTAPANCHHVDFRFGTVQAGSICTFSEISFYECDANGNPLDYKVLATDGQKDEHVLSKLNIPSANKCNASYSMTGKEGLITSSHTIDTNLNITLDTEHAYGNFTHKYTDGSAYNKDTTYTHTGSCSKCGNNDTQPCEFGDLDSNGNTATLTCSVCGGTYTLDLEAYNKAVADANTSVNNSVAYTSDSRTALSSVLSAQAAALSSAKTQADVDNCTNTIISKNKLTTADSAGVLVLEKYSITFNVATVDGKTLATNITGTGTYDYGTMVELDLPEQYQTNYVVTTWKRYAKGEDKVVGGTSTKLYVIVNQESTYTAVINSVATDNVGDNEAVLTLNNKSGKTVDVGIVDTTQEQTVTVNIADSKIKIGSVELTAPTYSFYTLKGFYIDETLYTESGRTVKITKDTVITPYYDASLFVDIKRASGETFTINGDDKAPYTANWNQKVTLKSETEVYWYNENDVLLGKGTTYSFYANSEVTIHTEPVDSVQNVDPTASIGYFNYDSTLNKVTVVNNFFVPDRMTVTKAGVILSTKNSTREALIAQTNGKFEGGPESFTSTGNQIRISVSRTANTEFTMYALAYVVVDGQTYYANEVKTINYTPKSA